MRAIGSLVAIVASLVIAVSWSSVTAQDDEPEATIAALQTEVAELEETIEALQPEPTPTHAPRPTPDLDGEPIDIGNGIEVLYYEVVEDNESSVLIGEYRNASGETLYSPTIDITIFDAEGNVLETTSAYPVYSNLEPGDTTPFMATYIPLEAEEWGSEELVACETYGEFDEDATALLELEQVSEEEKSDERLVVSGVVRNNGDDPIEGAEVIAVMWDENGKFVGSTNDYVDAEIPAGRTAPFDLRGAGAEMAAVEDDEYTYDL